MAGCTQTIVRRGVAGLGEDLARQRDFVATSSPIYAAVLQWLLDSPDTYHAPLERAWVGRTFGAWYERPLLLLASLRFDALQHGAEHPLWGGLAAIDAHAGAMSADALQRALGEERRTLWRSLAERQVQTNETTRAIAWMWPACLAPSSTPLELFDLGASAGLNLVADGLPAPWTDAEGQPLVPHPPGDIERRVALDLRPLDPRDEQDVSWLRACVWPEQHERLARLDAALARARELPIMVIESDAAAMPGHLQPESEHARLLAYQTIMRDYLPPAVRDEMAEGMRRWLLAHPPGRALWVELEQDDAEQAPDRAIALTSHVVDATGELSSLALARCHPHPRILHVDASAVQSLARALAQWA